MNVIVAPKLKMIFFLIPVIALFYSCRVLLVALYGLYNESLNIIHMSIVQRSPNSKLKINDLIYDNCFEYIFVRVRKGGVCEAVSSRES